MIYIYIQLDILFKLMCEEDIMRMWWPPVAALYAYSIYTPAIIEVYVCTHCSVALHVLRPRY